MSVTFWVIFSTLCLMLAIPMIYAVTRVAVYGEQSGIDPDVKDAIMKALDAGGIEAACSVAKIYRKD